MLRFPLCNQKTAFLTVWPELIGTKSPLSLLMIICGGRENIYFISDFQFETGNVKPYYGNFEVYYSNLEIYYGNG